VLVVAPGARSGDTNGPVRLLPFGSIVFAAFAPVATGIYLLVTTAWTVAQRAVLHPATGAGIPGAQLPIQDSRVDSRGTHAHHDGRHRMKPTLFGLAEIDEDTGTPDPERVRMWAMETDHSAVLHWRHPSMSLSGGWASDHHNQFAVFDSAARAEARFGPIFDVGLVYP
jgi:hypothetical protein